jgi:DNA-binding transcriptional MerR regulator
MYIQLQRLFDKAVSSNRCDVVSYLFKEKKVPLEVVKDLCSEDENMQQILKSCQEKLEQQNKLYKESIDEHIKTIQNNKIGDLFIVNKPVDGESSGSIFDSIKFLSGQLLDNPQNIYLREKIQEINVAWVDNIYDHCPDNVAIMKAMEALSKINNNLRALTDEEKEARNNLRKIIMDGQGFKSDQCGKYLESIYKIYNRVEADKQLKEDMLCALGKRVLECIHQVNKGVSVGDQGDFIVCSVNAVPSSGSTEEDLFFEMLKALVKIDNAKQGNRNLLAGYEDKKNKYIAEIKQKKTEKLAANNGDTVINNQNSSFGLSTIIDIVSSFFTQLFSFLQWLNPFRLVIG